MKIYSVDRNGNFIKKRKTAQTKREAGTSVFGICFEPDSDNGVTLKIETPTGAHRGGLAEISALKDLFKIKSLDGKPVLTQDGESMVFGEGWGSSPDIPDDPTPPPPPPGQGVLSRDELRKKQQEKTQRPSSVRQLA
jgi:hypothetical protein